MMKISVFIYVRAGTRECETFCGEPEHCWTQPSLFQFQQSSLIHPASLSLASIYQQPAYVVQPGLSLCSSLSSKPVFICCNRASLCSTEPDSRQQSELALSQILLLRAFSILSSILQVHCNLRPTVFFEAYFLLIQFRSLAELILYNN